MGMAVLELLKSWECGVILGFDVAWWCLMKVIELTWVDSLIVEWWWFQYVSVWSHCLILFVSFKLFLTTTYYDSALAKKKKHTSYVWIMKDWEKDGTRSQVKHMHLLLSSGVVHPKKVWVPEPAFDFIVTSHGLRNTDSWHINRNCHRHTCVFNFPIFVENSWKSLL